MEDSDMAFLRRARPLVGVGNPHGVLLGAGDAGLGEQVLVLPHRQPLATLGRGRDLLAACVAEGDRDADHVTVRKTVRHSLSRLKEFWQDHGVWPDSTLKVDGTELIYSGPTPGNIESAACTECRANVWTTDRGPYVAEYDTGAICGYCCYECYFSHRHRNNLEEIAGDRSVYIPPA